MLPELNEYQWEAAEHTDGPALVLAGPGSGKTTVVISRAVRTASGMKDPGRLLLVTFTTAAAGEMRQRYLQYTGGAEGRGVPLFSTVHAFANGIVGMFERRKNVKYTRIEGEDSPKNAILSGIYKKLNGALPDEAMLERVKMYLARPGGEKQIRRFAEIKSCYEREKAANMYIDFEDMVRLALRIMETEPEISREVAGMFDYIMVDEAQDLSADQYRLIRLIGRHRNVFVVADDDQSIYGFRGAEPGCLFEFVNENKDCKVYKLTRNYRSSEQVVRCSSALVSRNLKRFDKQLYTENAGRRDAVMLCRFTDGADQARFCAETALGAAAEGSTAGILYRNGFSSLPLRALFRSRGIRYSVDGSCPEAWSIDGVRDCLREVSDAERRAVILPNAVSTYKRLVREGFGEQLAGKCRREGRDAKSAAVTMVFLKVLLSEAKTYREAVRLLDLVDSDAIDETRSAGGKNAPLVKLSTIHSSKGLEYDTVCLIDLLEGELPGTGAAGDALEEERRLLYVGMTRAKKRLFLCRPERRGIFREKDSRFLSEIFGKNDAVKAKSA